MDTISTEPQNFGCKSFKSNFKIKPATSCLSGYSLNLTRKSSFHRSTTKGKHTWKIIKKLVVRLQRKASFAITNEECGHELNADRNKERGQVVNCFYSSTECLSPFVLSSPSYTEKASRQTTVAPMPRRLTISDRPCCRPCHIPPNICRSKPRFGCVSPGRCTMSRRSPSDEEMNACFKHCQNQMKQVQRSRPQLLDSDDNKDNVENDFTKVASQKSCKQRCPSPRLIEDTPRHSNDNGKEFVCEECKKRSRSSSQQRDQSHQNNIRNMSSNSVHGCGHMHGCPWQAAYNNITMGMPPCFPVYPPNMNYTGMQPNFPPQFPHSFPAPNSMPPNYSAMPSPGMPPAYMPQPPQGQMGSYTGQGMPMQSCRNVSSEREVRPLSGISMSGGVGPGAWNSTSGGPGLIHPANSTMNSSGVHIQDEYFCPMGRSTLCPQSQARSPMPGGNLSNSALDEMKSCSCPPGEQCSCRYPPAFSKYSCSGKQNDTCCCANKTKKPSP